jgi:hypothetical protein
VVDNVPYVLWFGRAPAALIEMEDRADQRAGAWRWLDRRAYTKNTLELSLKAVARVREVQQKVKMDMKRRHDENIKFVDLREGDLCYKYNEATLKRSEFLPARRLHRHWVGPYFITEIVGENAELLHPKTGVTKKCHRNLCMRYVYPLAGPQLLGERRKAYLDSVTGRRAIRGNVQFNCLWRSGRHRTRVARRRACPLLARRGVREARRRRDSCGGSARMCFAHPFRRVSEPRAAAQMTKENRPKPGVKSLRHIFGSLSRLV